jgi:hypothetical protein
MKAYKVVTIKSNRYWSCRTYLCSNLEYILRTAFPTEPIEPRVLEYKVGEVTVPAFGAIFAFDSPLKASAFIRRYLSEGSFAILEGEGRKYRNKGIAFLYCSASSKKMAECWKKAIHSRRTISTTLEASLPDGTILMKDFKPTDIVVLHRGKLPYLPSFKEEHNGTVDKA